MARRAKKANGRAGVGLDGYVRKQLKDPEFRHHFDERRLVHDLAVVVRSMREQAGLTQAQLARMVGVSQPMIARMERGLDQRTAAQPHESSSAHRSRLGQESSSGILKR